jgi:hypothetical protein
MGGETMSRTVKTRVVKSWSELMLVTFQDGSCFRNGPSVVIALSLIYRFDTPDVETMPKQPIRGQFHCVRMS